MISVFPSVLKTPKVVPILMEVSKLDYNNYCSISMLSSIEKIFEKLIYKRLFIFINNNNIIYNFQFRYGQHYCTFHALSNITEKNYGRLKYRLRSFCGFTKSFYTVDHPMFLTKLNYYGIREVQNDCFKSYLSNRSQYVSIDGIESGIAAINCGIPQESVVGHRLFLLSNFLLSDLNEATNFYKVHFFANDPNLFCLSNSTKKLKKLVNAD